MAWNYNPLWINLIQHGMKKTDLMTAAKVSSVALAKMGRNQPVTMDTLERLCKIFGCGLDGIVEYVPDSEDMDESK